MAHSMRVRIIACSGESALVEWAEEGLHRAYVPASLVMDGECDSDTLAAGIPYGVRFEELLTPGVTPERIAHELRRRGIWTTDDLRRKPNTAITALQAAYRIDLAALLAATMED